MAKEVFYVELAKAKTQKRRNIVISECSRGGFTIAQQLEVDEGKRTTNVFLKGAFHIDNIDGLYNMRDAINAAIKAHEDSMNESDSIMEAVDKKIEEENEEWDE